MSRRVPAAAVAALALGAVAAAAAGCDLAAAEVAVRNDLDAPVQVKSVSFNGCLWPGVLAPGEATVPCRCEPGRDRVRFERQDPDAWAEDRSDGATDAAPDAGAVARWYRYRSTRAWSVDRGDVRVLSITSDTIEQDFDAPGPYGH